MDDRHSIIDSITGAFVPIHPDGTKFVAIAGGVTLLLFLIAGSLGWLGVIATVYCAYFFRDPERVTPKRPGVVVSAADGRITGLGKIALPVELGAAATAATRVSVFLSVFDVHIIRAPAGGKIVRTTYVPGKFLNAELDKASEENERL